MMTNKEKFLQLVSTEKTNTVARAKERKMNRSVLRRSQEIALAVLERLDALNWTQRQLAEEMGVQPQQVNRWLKGSENFSLSTLVQLEEVLNLSLIAVQGEQKKLETKGYFFEKNTYKTTKPTNSLLKTVVVAIEKNRTYRKEYSTAI